METITLEKYRKIFGFPVKDYYIKLGFDLKNESFEECGLEFIQEYENRRYEEPQADGVRYRKPGEIPEETPREDTPSN